MATLHGSRTEQNLLKAFAGESQARLRYDFFASQAKKDGLEQIAAIFLESSGNEREHAKRFFTFLEGTAVEITAHYPAGRIGTTLENLKAAAEGETEEWMDIYPLFAAVAEEEGFKEIATAFRMIAKVEKAHADRYLAIYENLESGKVFERDGVMVWKCRNCGYLHEGRKAPEICPACLHPQAYFELQSTNY